MHRNLAALSFVLGLGIHGIAMADNALSSDQLMRATQLSLQDNATVNPDMVKSVSGFRISTVGPNAQVLVDMYADGMKMSVKYLCVLQANDMTCNVQQ